MKKSKSTRNGLVVHERFSQCDLTIDLQWGAWWPRADAFGYTGASRRADPL